MGPHLRDRTPSFCQTAVSRCDMLAPIINQVGHPDYPIPYIGWSPSEVFGKRTLTNSIEGCSL
jgi:hypothetical protein